MRKNNIQTLCCVALPLTIAVGCAHMPQQETELYSPVDAAALTPTSTRPVSRVYADDQGPQGITRTTPAKGASAEDWALGEELRGALTTEKSLAPYPSEISVEVAKDSKGLVRLRGVVPNDQERKRLHDRIATVPGVLQIDDQVVVGLPVHPGNLDIQKPISQQ